MPTYQYACTECGHGFEQFQSFSDDALTECPTCGGRLRKVFNSVGIVFKGSGFYRNDSREAAKGKGKDGKSKESVGSGKADSSSDKSSDKSSGKGSGSDKKSDSAAAATSSSSGKGGGSSGGSSGSSSSSGSPSGSSSTAGSAA